MKKNHPAINSSTPKNFHDTYTYNMYYAILLPCVLKTEDMTAATANSSIFIFILILTVQENKGNSEW